ncbi:TLC domain-containing protein [Myxozyma melibiosi]|uniref:TLC domain-containing protein n=1 Tax=Myxozyma melibiosi TaxID=54550 RepID=A0ABR1F2H5_9ASCO
MKDFLAIEYPPAVQETLTTVCNAIGLPMLAPHIHEVVLAFALYHGLFLMGPLFNSAFSSYKTMPRRTRINFDIHVVSQVQCLLIIALAFPAFFDPELKVDHLFAYSPYGGLVYAFAVGYFAWDSYISLKYINWFGIGFAVHGIASVSVFLLSFRPFLMYYGPVFLMFEISTPFLNVHWFTSHLPPNTVPEKVQLVNGVLLLLSFFLARLVWGFASAGVLIYDFYKAWGDPRMPFWLPCFVLTSNLSLDFLNVYWFSKMIKAVQRRLDSNKKHKPDNPDLLTEEEDIKGHKME